MPDRNGAKRPRCGRIIPAKPSRLRANANANACDRLVSADETLGSLNPAANAAHDRSGSEGEVQAMTYVITDVRIEVKNASSIDSGAFEPACPVEAIYSDLDLPPDHEKYLAVNPDYFKS